MITGQGVDIVEINRISQAIERSGDSFLHRVYTNKEISDAQNKKQARHAYYAGRWAAKEALAKALGCGIGENCSFTDIEILNLPSGAPHMTLSGKALEYSKQIGCSNILVSISHEQNYAVAMVTLEM